MKRIALVALFLASVPLDAQIYDGRRTKEPNLWVSGSVAAFSADGINDGGTASSWDFSGTTPQFRGALEKTIANQTAVGIAVGYMNMPFTYRSSAAGANSCLTCDATMKFYTAALTLHVGGGTGFHQVLEASAGVNLYRDLKRESDGLVLDPIEGNIDPAFAFGYGFGFNFNPANEVFIIQDYGIALHERDGLQNNQSNTLTMRTTRIGYRMGFGTRAPVRR